MSRAKAKGTTLNELDANPAKAFFVDMLTRDLTLDDAILDLLDNCVDGALRSKINQNNTIERFKGYKAEILLARNKFEVKDNCGGIPESKLRYAFMHGRAPGGGDAGLPTVGIYGIGMKRAIYKIGKEAKVATQSGKLSCEVPFTKTWMAGDSWVLPIKGTAENFEEDGTIVEVSVLRPEVSHAFGVGLPEFVKNLRRQIGEHYAYIIKQGFRVFINGESVMGLPISIIYQETLARKAWKPFFWESEINGVKIFLSVGFYTPPPSKAELEDEENDEENWKSEQSGWTILCNHRVVAYCDKTFLTGWGDKPIPRFHSQFNAIRGLVVFESDDASRLPTTTTKRGLDTGKQIYAEVKNVMKEGLRVFIDSTNKWKGETESSREQLRSDDMKPLGLDELRSKARAEMAVNRGGAGGYISRPILPEPDRPDKATWMRFARPRDEVKIVAGYLLGDEDSKPALVAEKCFEQILKKAAQ